MTWTSYRPQDLLLFDETVYWRLFELHNQMLWPLPLVLPALGVLMLAAGLFWPKPWIRRAWPTLLAALWCLVALAFLWYRYAPINWAALYLVPVFILQALLLLWLGTLSGQLDFGWRRDRGGYLGLGLFLYALLVHPFTAMLAGRPLQGAEVFGLAPDPTAIATLGLVVSAGPLRRAWPLLVIPLIWCLLSWLTLSTLGTPLAWIPLLSAVIGVIAATHTPKAAQ